MRDPTASSRSTDDVYPIDVGLKLPVEHVHGSTYGFFFHCFADVMIDIGYRRTFARTAGG
jgi:hypothetical protein